MRKDLFTLPARGMCVKEVGQFLCCSGGVASNALTEKFLDDATVQGFPIVSTDAKRTLLGYIERQELRYVLGAPSLPRHSSAR